MMYWIYYSIFLFIVFAPLLIKHGMYGFNLVQTQELAILLGGLLGFLTFIIQNKSLKKNKTEKRKIQNQANQMSKDLTNSYSYIGETNRKLDILEQIIINYPEKTDLTIRKRNEAYAHILEAIKLLCKSNEFMLRFTSVPKNDILKEVKSFKELSLNFSCKKKNSQFMESDEFVMVSSPKPIDDVTACIIIHKEKPNYKIEDIEILKSIASQALFLFTIFNKKKRDLEKK